MKFITLGKLSSEIKDSKHFSILADEAADISNKENLSILIRFVDALKPFERNLLAIIIVMKEQLGELLKQ